MKTVHVTIRPIGNSHGVVIPKPLLAQAGLVGGVAEMAIGGDALVLRRVTKPARSGWAQAAAKIADQNDDGLVMGEFGNKGDAGLVW